MALRDVPLSRWSTTELAAEAARTGLVTQITEDAILPGQVPTEYLRQVDAWPYTLACIRGRALNVPLRDLDDLAEAGFRADEDGRYEELYPGREELRGEPCTGPCSCAPRGTARTAGGQPSPA